MLRVWRFQMGVRQNKSGAGGQVGEEGGGENGQRRVSERAVVLIERAGFCKIERGVKRDELVKKIPDVCRATDRVTRAVRVIASVVYGQEGRKDVPGLADYRAENLVVINAISGSDGSLAVLERIPGEGDVRGDVVGV